MAQPDNKLCNICKDNSKDTKVIVCAFCEDTFHSKCANIKDAALRLINGDGNIVFKCDVCKNRKNKDVIGPLKELQSTVDKCLLRLKEQGEIIESNKKLIEQLIRQNKAGQDKSGYAKSYAEAVSKNNRECIIVKATNESNVDETIKDIKDKIDPCALEIGIENMKTIKGGVLISCSTAGSKGKITEKIQEEFGDRYNITDAQFRKPRMIIVGVEEHVIGKNNEEIMEMINNQNDLAIDEGQIEISRKYINKKRRNSGNIIIDVSPRTYEQLNTVGTINIGWRQCKVYEHFNVLRCFKCARYHHKSTDCDNKVTCFKCSGEHETNDCKSDSLKCINCSTTMNKLKIKLDVNHAAYDKNCPVYKRIIENECKKIKYSPQ